MDKKDKKVSYRKQIAHQHLCHKKVLARIGTWSACTNYPLI